MNFALSVGAAAGILLSAGFVLWEVGRYAAPQVPRSRFDERKEMIAYTAGLFVGIPLVIPFLFLFQALPMLALGGVALYLAVLVGGTELAQYLLLRSAYFGRDGAGPFYALGLRCGIAGLLVIALVTEYFSGPSYSLPGALAAISVSLGIVSLEGVGAILSMPTSKAPGRPRRGGPWSGIPMAAVGFVLIGFGYGSGALPGVLIGLLVAGGAFLLYRSAAPGVLSSVPPPSGPDAAPSEGEPTPFARTDRRPGDR